MGIIRQTIQLSLAAATLLGGAFAHAQDQITFEQVLADPTDPALNLAYAQQRIDTGDLLAAAATLERLLINEPNWDQARLLYAGILFQLGDFQAAKREADLLEGRDMSEDSLAEVEKYRNASSKKTNRNRFSGRISLGVGYDENAGSQLAEDLNAATGETELSFEQVDQFSSIVRGNVKFERDLSDTTEFKGFITADAFLKTFEDADFDEFLIANVKAGLSNEARLANWRFNLSGRQISIGAEKYLEEVGYQLRLSRDLTKKTTASFSYGFHSQEYESIFGDGDNSTSRDGDRYDVALSLRHSFSPKYRGSFGVSYRHKTVSANEAPDGGTSPKALFAYDYLGASGGFNIYWQNGAYLDTTALYREYEYEGEGDEFQREDDFVYTRVALGLPLTVLTQEKFKAALEPILLEAAISMTDRDSTVSTATTPEGVNAFDFDNTGAEVRLIYRF